MTQSKSLSDKLAMFLVQMGNLLCLYALFHLHPFFRGEITSVIAFLVSSIGGVAATVVMFLYLPGKKLVMVSAGTWLLFLGIVSFNIMFQ